MSLHFAGRVSRYVVLRIAARGLAAALQAAVLVIVAREAGATVFGMFALVLSVGYIVSALTGVGASSRILRVSAEHEAKALGDTLLVLRLIGSAFTVAGCLTFAVFGVDISLTLAAAAIVASDQLIDYAQAYLAGHSRQVASSLIVIVQRLIPFSGIAILAVLGEFSFSWLALFYVPVAVGSMLPLLLRMSRPGNAISVARASTGYWISGIASNLSQLEPIVLSAIVSPAVVGNYAIAARLTNPLTIVTSAMQTVLVPELARTLGTPAFARLFRSFLVATVGYAFLLSLCSPLIAEGAILLLGSEYSSGRELIVAMVVASALSAVAQAFQAKLIAEARPSSAALVVSVGVVTGLVGILVIVASFGPDLLWIAPVFTQCIICGGMAIASRAKLRPTPLLLE